MNINMVIEENRELIMRFPHIRFISILKKGNEEVIVVNVSPSKDEEEQERSLREIASKIPGYRIEMYVVHGGL